MKNLYFLSIVLGIISSLSAVAQTPGSGYSLTLNGSSQYVAIPASPSLNPSSEITLEAWYTPTVSWAGAGNTPIVMKSFTSHTPPHYQYGLYAIGDLYGNPSYHGQFVFLITNSSNTVFSVLTPINFFTIGEIYHIAGTYDGAIIKLYVNGILISSSAANGTLASFNTGVEIGKLRNYNSYLPGVVDEVKIWSTALSQTEIRDWMCKKVTSAHPNYSSLVSYYKFDAGNGSILIDSTGNNDGTLINAPTWQLSNAPIGDESVNDYGSGDATTITQPHSDGSNFTINNFSGSPDGAHLYIVNEAPNANTETLSGALEETRYYGTFIVNGTSPTYSATYNYSGNPNIDGAGTEPDARLTKRDNNSITNWSLNGNSFSLNEFGNEISICKESSRGEYCAGFDNTAYIKQPGSGYSLAFDGSNDYVNLGNTIGGQLKTIEFWFSPSSNIDNTNTNVMSLFVRNDGSQSDEIQVYISGWAPDQGKLIFGRHSTSSGSVNVKSDNSTWVSGKWYHVAGVFDPIGGMQLYINGIKQLSTNSHTGSPGSRPEILSIGRWGDLAIRHFNGNIDEIKLWNTALSQTEIRDWMCKKVTSSHPQYCNLVSYYRFDNASGTNLTDYAGNNDGTLINSPSWQLSSAPIGDESAYQYSNTLSVSLSHPDGDNLTVNAFTGSPTAAHVYMVNEYPNTLSGTQGVGINDKYFGVFKIGDNSATYTVNYDYTGNPGVGANESNLKLYKRNDNATTLWVDATATLNAATNILSTIGQNTEYILGRIGTPLPVELVRFEAICNQDKVDITWSTQTEINNDYFVIEKSNDAIQFFELTTTQGAGNSNDINNYIVVDNNTTTNVVYYRLKQVDFNGETTYHYPVSIHCQNNSNSYIYPNPNKGIVNIVLGNLKNAKVKVFNITGQLVHQQININNPTYQFEIVGTKGIYFVELTSEGKTKRFKVIKN
jgi:hypothetical protein